MTEPAYLAPYVRSFFEDHLRCPPQRVPQHVDELPWTRSSCSCDSRPSG